jgi:hypothetical protein
VKGKAIIESIDDDVHNYITSKWSMIVAEIYKEVFADFGVDDVLTKKGDEKSDTTIFISNGDVVNITSKNSPLEAIVDINGEYSYRLIGKETNRLPHKVRDKYMDYMSK